MAGPYLEIPIGYCLDTCHCYVSGRDISTAIGLATFVREADDSLGLDHVPVIHANDAKTPLGSHLDRHANIGAGYIGKEGFRRILNHPRLRDKAFILETPVDEPGDDLRNVTALKELVPFPNKRLTTKKSRAKWHERWKNDPTLYVADSPEKPKYYVLEMLPYPSGTLHMGHVRNYSIGDALARYKWMRGYNVLHPMGWDAFGLPAENAAIENKPPSARVDAQQHRAHEDADAPRFGFSYDWDREIATCEPEYYRWNQWFFLQDARARPGLSQESAGELVSGVRDRAGQRAGGGRLLLASRNHAGRAARAASSGS